MSAYSDMTSISSNKVTRPQSAYQDEAFVPLLRPDSARTRGSTAECRKRRVTICDPQTDYLQEGLPHPSSQSTVSNLKAEGITLQNQTGTDGGPQSLREKEPLKKWQATEQYTSHGVSAGYNLYREDAFQKVSSADSKLASKGDSIKSSWTSQNEPNQNYPSQQRSNLKGKLLRKLFGFRRSKSEDFLDEKSVEESAKESKRKKKKRNKKVSDLEEKRSASEDFLSTTLCSVDKSCGCSSQAGFVSDHSAPVSPDTEWPGTLIGFPVVEADPVSSKKCPSKCQYESTSSKLQYDSISTKVKSTIQSPLVTKQQCSGGMTGNTARYGMGQPQFGAPFEKERLLNISTSDPACNISCNIFSSPCMLPDKNKPRDNLCSPVEQSHGSCPSRALRSRPTSCKSSTTVLNFPEATDSLNEESMTQPEVEATSIKNLTPTVAVEDLDNFLSVVITNLEQELQEFSSKDDTQESSFSNELQQRNSWNLRGETVTYKKRDQLCHWCEGRLVEPRLLPCLHSVCTVCLSQLLCSSPRLLACSDTLANFNNVDSSLHHSVRTNDDGFRSQQLVTNVPAESREGEGGISKSNLPQCFDLQKRESRSGSPSSFLETDLDAIPFKNDGLKENGKKSSKENSLAEVTQLLTSSDRKCGCAASNLGSNPAAFQSLENPATTLSKSGNADFCLLESVTPSSCVQEIKESDLCLSKNAESNSCPVSKTSTQHKNLDHIHLQPNLSSTIHIFSMFEKETQGDSNDNPLHPEKTSKAHLESKKVGAVSEEELVLVAIDNADENITISGDFVTNHSESHLVENCSKSEESHQTASHQVGAAVPNVEECNKEGKYGDVPPTSPLALSRGDQSSECDQFRPGRGSKQKDQTPDSKRISDSLSSVVNSTGEEVTFRQLPGKVVCKDSSRPFKVRSDGNSSSTSGKKADHYLSESKAPSSPEGWVAWCPVCGRGFAAPLGVDSFPVNYILQRELLEDLEDSSEEFSCDLCSQAAKASHRCDSCPANMCELCYQAHKRQRRTSHHITAPLEQVKSDCVKDVQPNLECLHHDGEVQWWCRDCQEPLCGACLMQPTHKFHHTGTTENEATFAKEALKAAHTKASSRMDELETSLEQLKNYSAKLQERGRSVADEVNAFIDDYILALEEHRYNLLRQVRSAAEKGKMGFLTEAQLGRQTINCLQDGTDFASAVLAHSSPTESLILVSSVLRRLQELCCIRLQGWGRWGRLDLLRGHRAGHFRGHLLEGVIADTAAYPATTRLQMLWKERFLPTNCAVTALVMARDDNGHPISHGGETFSAKLFSEGRDLINICAVKDRHDGSYEVSVLSKDEGKFSLHVTLHRVHIKGSPLTLEFKEDIALSSKEARYSYCQGYASPTGENQAAHQGIISHRVSTCSNQPVGEAMVWNQEGYYHVDI